jgi:hypothetical protein
MITDLRSHGTDLRQEIRITHNGGGPGGMEVIYSCTREGIKISVFNPYRHEWSTVNQEAITNHGDTRK